MCIRDSYSTTASPKKEGGKPLKNGKRPTRQQKMRLKGLGLNPENWLIVKNKPDGELELVHRHTNRIRVVPASVG